MIKQISQPPSEGAPREIDPTVLNNELNQLQEVLIEMKKERKEFEKEKQQKLATVSQPTTPAPGTLNKANSKKIDVPSPIKDNKKQSLKISISPPKIRK